MKEDIPTTMDSLSIIGDDEEDNGDEESEDEKVIQLKFQSSPVRVLEILNFKPCCTTDYSVDKDKSSYSTKYLVFAQGCKLFYQPLPIVTGSRSSSSEVLKEFQVFPNALQINGLALSPCSRYLFVVSKDVGRILSVNFIRTTTDKDHEKGVENQVNVSFKIVSSFYHLNRWTKAIHWISDNTILNLTSQNELISWHWTDKKCNKRRKKELMLHSLIEYKIPEIYYGRIYYNNNNSSSITDTNTTDKNDELKHVLICSGTIFGAVHLWNILNSTPNVLHILNDHQGPICYIELFLASYQLISTSDDRTAKLYTITSSTKMNTAGEQQQNKMDCLDLITDKKRVNNCCISLSFSFYGHTSRVYQGILATPNYVVTSSNDSTICIWTKSVDCGDKDKEWEVVRRWEANRGSPIRCITYDSILDMLFTGGDDGSIQKLNVNFQQDAFKRTTPIELYPGAHPDSTNWGNPRVVALWKPNIVLGITDHAPIKKYSSSTMSENALPSINNSIRCTVMTFSPCKTYLLCGNPQGAVDLYFATADHSKLTPIWSWTYAKTPISNFKWLVNSNNILKFIVSTHSSVHLVTLTCTNPIGHEYNLVSNSELSLQHADIIAGPKTPKITAATQCRQYHLVLGDENGILYIFSRNPEHQLKSIYKKWHAKYGISCLNTINDDGDKIISTGRDCFIKMFNIHPVTHQIIGLSVIRSPFEWIDHTMHYNNGIANDILCVGFKETKFLIYSLTTRSIIAELDCGGAHRSYDFILSQDLALHLVYVRNKQILHSTQPIFEWLHPLKLGYPAKKINCGVQLAMVTNSYLFFAIGGEDTLITIFTYHLESGHLNFIQDLMGHSSSVRTLVYEPAGGYLISGGGRSELIIWKLHLGIELGSSSNEQPYVRYEKLKTIKLTNTEVNGASWGCVADESIQLDFRILDIKTIQHCKDLIIIFAATSNGNIYMLGFSSPAPSSSNQQHQLKIYAILEQIQESEEIFISHCISSLFVINNSSKDICHVYGGTTTGQLFHWTCNLVQIVEEFQSTQIIIKITSSTSYKLSSSPITSVLALTLEEESSTRKIVIGCDDGTLLGFDLDLKPTPTTDLLLLNESIWLNNITRHNSTILALNYVEHGLLIVSSVDQVISKWNLNAGACDLELRAGVTDCQAMICLPNPNPKNSNFDECICICLGDGISIFNLKL